MQRKYQVHGSGCPSVDFTLSCLWRVLGRKWSAAQGRGTKVSGTWRSTNEETIPSFWVIALSLFRCHRSHFGSRCTLGSAALQAFFVASSNPAGHARKGANSTMEPGRAVATPPQKTKVSGTWRRLPFSRVCPLCPLLPRAAAKRKYQVHGSGCPSADFTLFCCHPLLLPALTQVTFWPKRAKTST